jgi:hypothetical protein|tara:strand:+ start:189 stop:983 length:795 start_codon:yes stop_codon:yes gene_type:complete
MKALHIYIIAFALLIFNTSCEKVILIELNEVDQKIVVDAIVSNDSVQNYVILSKSGGFYQSNDFVAISGALVTITDEGGTVYTLAESNPGYYSDANLIGQLRTNYSLEVITDNQTITGSTYIPDTTHLDSLSYFLNSSGFGDPEWFVLMHWSDEVVEENFYRFKTTINGYKENRVTLLDDLLINGIETQYPLFDVEVKDYDTLEVEFIEIDKGTYNYLKVLGEIDSGDNAASAAPGNPISNLTGNALGFFGGYAITNGSIVIEP